MTRFRYYLATVLSVAAVICGALATVGGAVPASASVAVRPVAASQAVKATTHSIGTVYSQEMAGYQTSQTGWHFRFVSDTMTLPNSINSPYPGEGQAVHLASANGTLVLGESTSKGSTSWNGAIAFERKYGQGGCADPDGCMTHSRTASPAMMSGDNITYSVYYQHVQGMLFYSVVDNTSGDSFTGRFVMRDAQFTSAAVVTEFGVAVYSPATGYVQPAETVTLATHHVVFTSYNGTHGYLGAGHWTTDEIVLSSTGKATGSLDVFPTVPSLLGSKAFSVIAQGPVPAAS